MIFILASTYSRVYTLLNIHEINTKDCSLDKITTSQEAQKRMSPICLDESSRIIYHI